MVDPGTPLSRSDERVANRRRTRWTLVGLVLLFLILALVFSGVLKMRLSSGDIYPHYSSLRSDPLGTKALYESLQRMPGVAVERNFRTASNIEGVDQSATVLLLGVPRASLVWLDIGEEDALLKSVAGGARLVIAVNPGLVPRTGKAAEAEWWRRHQRIRKAQRESGEVGRELTAEERKEIIDELRREKREGIEAEDVELFENLISHLGARVVIPESFDRPDDGWEIEASGSLPGALPDWFSQCRLDKLGPEWRVLATISRTGEPVIAERAYGKGTVVLASDAYFASNEALWAGASSEFLLWLMGDKGRVIFDESIHGARRSSNVAQWMLRHRLHGVVFGLLLVAGLFAWRSGSSLVPKRADLDSGSDDGNVVMGEGIESGLAKLLRRSVEPSSLLARCVALWRESTALGRGTSRRRSDSETAREIDSVVGSGGDPVASYREIVEILQRRRF